MSSARWNGLVARQGKLSIIVRIVLVVSHRVDEKTPSRKT